MKFFKRVYFVLGWGTAILFGIMMTLLGFLVILFPPSARSAFVQSWECLNWLFVVIFGVLCVFGILNVLFVRKLKREIGTKDTEIQKLRSYLNIELPNDENG